MKNRDENTTIIQLSYRTFTIFEYFFSVKFKKICILKKLHKGAFLKYSKFTKGF